MNPLLLAYGFLTLAIVSEVAGSSFLQRSAQFTKLVMMCKRSVTYIVHMEWRGVYLPDH